MLFYAVIKKVCRARAYFYEAWFTKVKVLKIGTSIFVLNFCTASIVGNN